MCLKKYCNHRNKREYIKNNSFASKRIESIFSLISQRQRSLLFSFPVQRTFLSLSHLNTVLFHLRLCLHQHFLSSSTSQTSNPSRYYVVLKQLWHGYAEPNQSSSENHPNIPHKLLLPFSTVLLFIQSGCLIWLKAKLCKELSQDSQNQGQTAMTQVELKQHCC